MFEVDVKNVTHLCKKRVGVKEGRSEGGDQARFFNVDIFIHMYILTCLHILFCFQRLCSLE